MADDPLVGLWRTHGGYYILRAADSTLALGYSAGGADSDPFGWGTYTFDESAGVFTFTSGVGTECGPNVTGTYEAEISQDGEQATFTLVEDPCTLRHNTMSGEQTRISPEP